MKRTAAASTIGWKVDFVPDIMGSMSDNVGNNGVPVSPGDGEPSESKKEYSEAEIRQVEVEWLAGLPKGADAYAEPLVPQFLWDPLGKQKWTRLALRRWKIADLIVRGYSTEDVAKKIGCSARTIGRDLEFLWKQWKQQQNQMRDQAIVLQLRQIDSVINEAWAGWNRSIGEVEEHTSVINHKGQKRGTTKRQFKAGDSQFLRTILEALKQRADLLGLEPPKQLEVNESRKYQVQISQLTTAQKELLVELSGKMPLQIESQ